MASSGGTEEELGESVRNAFNLLYELGQYTASLGLSDKQRLLMDMSSDFKDAAIERYHFSSTQKSLKPLYDRFNGTSTSEEFDLALKDLVAIIRQVIEACRAAEAERQRRYTIEISKQQC